ncbi:MAG: DUF4838 domain-containing protein [Gimesia sp.]|nr:DUF4838 domain-containing protein [Gimesia sp.]
MKFRLVVSLIALLLTSTQLPLHAFDQKPLPLVTQGKSAYVIYHAPEAPASVKLATKELQRMIAGSTGVTLKIQTEPAAPMLCIGENAASLDAGLNVSKLPADGFQILTKDGNIYIAGRDTHEKKFIWRGYKSRGTLFGVYEFLEREVGVRWLMPGEWGEDIPAKKELLISNGNEIQQPDFPDRLLEYVQDKRPLVQEWMLRRKIPPVAEGRKTGSGHSWDEYVSVKALQAHPEYMALVRGKRTLPVGRNYKLCTTNPELVDLFAKGVIESLHKRSWQKSASISASDGGAFCSCEKCSQLVTDDPHGKRSNTRLLLQFYHQVAQKVHKAHPDRLVGALVYYNYMYPPKEPMPISENLSLVWAPLNYYGYGLYKPTYQREFVDVVKGWTAITNNFVYHNYSTWMRSYNGAPLPPAREILKLELPTLKRQKVRGAIMVGQSGWGYGALTNYILSEQMWNADIDVDGLIQEWLRRAYGPGWLAMEQVYDLLDQQMKAYKLQEQLGYRGDQYEINADKIRQMYVPVFAQIEQLYLQAKAKTETIPQQKRLEMFGDNLIQLHFHMRQAALIKKPEQSTFYRSDKEFEKFMQAHATSLALSGGEKGKPHNAPVYIDQWGGEKTVYLKDAKK